MSRLTFELRALAYYAVTQPPKKLWRLVKAAWWAMRDPMLWVWVALGLFVVAAWRRDLGQAIGAIGVLALVGVAVLWQSGEHRRVYRRKLSRDVEAKR